jgi:hypothetical protein
MEDTSIKARVNIIMDRPMASTVTIITTPSLSREGESLHTIRMEKRGTLRDRMCRFITGSIARTGSRRIMGTGRIITSKIIIMRKKAIIIMMAIKVATRRSIWLINRVFMSTKEIT